MKLAVSNIAWSVEEEDRVADRLADQGVTGVEVAPTRHWPDLRAVTDRQVRDYRRYWNDRGLEISSMQALLFGQPELRVFGSPAEQQECLDYLDRVFALGAGLGAGVHVFGSPKNRLRGDLPLERAKESARDFFRQLGERAHSQGVTVGLEANPVDYGCDFLTDHGQLLDFVRGVDHPGIVQHFDLGGAILSAEDVAGVVASADRLAHVHLSEPFLDGLGQHAETHEQLARALDTGRYRGWVSIETRRSETDPIGRVEQAVGFVRSTYRIDDSRRSEVARSSPQEEP